MSGELCIGAESCCFMHQGNNNKTNHPLKIKVNQLFVFVYWTRTCHVIYCPRHHLRRRWAAAGITEWTFLQSLVWPIWDGGIPGGMHYHYQMWQFLQPQHTDMYNSWNIKQRKRVFNRGEIMCLSNDFSTCQPFKAIGLVVSCCREAHCPNGKKGDVLLRFATLCHNELKSAPTLQAMTKGLFCC